MMPLGHCLEYNYDYENGFSIGRIKDSHLPLKGIYHDLTVFPNIYQHQVVGATAGALRVPRITLILSPALLQAHVRLPDSSETSPCDLTHWQRGSEESGDRPETRKSRSFSTSQVREGGRPLKMHKVQFLNIWTNIKSSSKHPTAHIKK